MRKLLMVVLIAAVIGTVVACTAGEGGLDPAALPLVNGLVLTLASPLLLVGMLIVTANIAGSVWGQSPIWYS